MCATGPFSDLDTDFPRHSCCWQVSEMSERCSQHFHGILSHSHMWLLPWPFRVRGRVLPQLRRLHSQGDSPLPKGLTQHMLHRQMRAWEPHGRIHRASVTQHPREAKLGGGKEQPCTGETDKVSGVFLCPMPACISRIPGYFFLHFQGH